MQLEQCRQPMLQLYLSNQILYFPKGASYLRDLRVTLPSNIMIYMFLFYNTDSFHPESTD